MSTKMVEPKELKKRFCMIPTCAGERFDLVHKFPMDNQRAELWRKAIDVPEYDKYTIEQLRKRFFICRSHFRPEDYKNTESRSLNKTSIPSLNLKSTKNVKILTESFADVNEPQSEDVIFLQSSKNQNENKHYDSEEYSKQKAVTKKKINSIKRDHIESISCVKPKESIQSTFHIPKKARREMKVQPNIIQSHLPIQPKPVFLKQNILYFPISKDNIDSAENIYAAQPQFILSNLSSQNIFEVKVSNDNQIDQASFSMFTVESTSCPITMSDEFITINSGILPEPLKLNNFWLRDHCRCTDCYSCETYQRKQNVLDIPIDIKPKNYSIIHADLNVTWSDEHHSSYNILQIYNDQLENYQKKLMQTEKILWNKREIESLDYARVTLNDYLCDDEKAKMIVSSLLKYGVAFIEKVPANIQSTEVTIKRLFSVQKTLFGEMWSFTDEKHHSDSAYSKDSLGAHTDNTYFNNAAGIQVLHCIQHTGTGGESLLLDGFKTLHNLKLNYSDVFDRLCQTNVSAEYIEDGKHHTYCAPVIKLDPVTNLPEQLRFNITDRSVMNTLPQSKMLQFYKDYRQLAREIQSPQNEWWFKLTPGTVLLFDNWRVLHGRAAYSGLRHMVGCYIARGEFLSVARTMGLIC